MKEWRNIIDHYHYWRHDAIKAALDKNRHSFAVLCSNFGNDFNIAGVIRSANAFLAKEIIIYGRKRFDRRGTVGTHHYENLLFTKKFQDIIDKINSEGYTLVAIDNVEEAKNIKDFDWPQKTLMAFGQEQIGLPRDILEAADHKVYIKQYGSVRSLNVASAASICMFDWCNKKSDR